jgi:hypothetical protein
MHGDRTPYPKLLILLVFCVVGITIGCSSLQNVIKSFSLGEEILNCRPPEIFTWLKLQLTLMEHSCGMLPGVLMSYQGCRECGTCVESYFVFV